MLEGEAVVRKGVQRCSAYPLEHLTQGGIPAEVCAQDCEIGKQANQSLGVLVRSIGYEGTQTNVFLPCVAIYQRIEGGNQGHEQGSAFLPTQMCKGGG